MFPSSTEPLTGAIATVICGVGGGTGGGDGGVGWTKAAPPAQPEVQAHRIGSKRNAHLAGETLLFFRWERGRMPSEMQAKGQRKERGWGIGTRG